MKIWLLEFLVLCNPTHTRTQKHSYLHRDIYYMHIYKPGNIQRSQFSFFPQTIISVCWNVKKKIVRMTSVFFPLNKKCITDLEECIHSFIHSVLCLTTGPKPPPKRFLHIVRSRASSFKWEYHLLSLRSSSSFLRLLPRLLSTSICLFIFPAITCFRRQFLRKMWSIQLAFRFLISCINKIHIFGYISVHLLILFTINGLNGKVTC